MTSKQLEWIGRITVVTVGLAAAGVVAGGMTGVLLMLTWLVALGEWSQVGVFPLLLGWMLGGFAGAMLGPATAWLMMRHVPLGQAIGGTTLGTVAGGVFGALVGAPFIPLFPLAGFGVAALWLCFWHAAPVARIGPRSTPASW